MKRFSILPIIALVIGVTFSAFTNHPKQAVGQDPRWYYLGTDNSGVDTPGNYEPLTTQDASCSATPGVVCVIEAPDNGGLPDLNNDVVISFKP